MKSRQKKLSGQHGGTLMGVIIGLVIGLGIAVAVALLITKTSTPFTNKNAISDKTGAPATQMLDPNVPLYGNKNVAKDAAKDLAKNLENNKLDAKNDSKTAALTAEKADVKIPEVGNKTEAIDDKYVYFLQTGAFRERSDAESARAKLALTGFEASISEKSSDTGILYRVRIGPFGQLELMNRMRGRLSENGVDVAVIRTAR
jgi:cell division protein FtsN